jgi:biotin operon repressor
MADKQERSFVMSAKFQSFLAVLLLSALPVWAQNPKSAKAPATADWKDVDAAMGRSGQDQPDGTHKYSLPRKDMNVTVNGVQIKAGLALGSWVAFKSTSQGNAMAMGDLVLSEDEVGPVMAELQSGGIEITALHNHLLNESPRVMYMHIHGMGNAANLGKAIHSAIAKTKTPDAGAAAAPTDLDIDTKQIDQILGHGGKNNGGIYQVSVPRSEHITESGMAVPNSMGVATALNFQPTGGGKAAITGDFVLLGKEVNPVIKALRENGIAVTALHSHMLQEQPRLFFMHFWANDDALKLAKGLRAALDQTNSAKK